MVRPRVGQGCEINIQPINHRTLPSLPTQQMVSIIKAREGDKKPKESQTDPRLEVKLTREEPQSSLYHH